MLRYPKWEIHKVFLHFGYLAWKQNLSLPALADLIRASLKNRLPLDIPTIIEYNTGAIGVWRSLVSRLVRVQEASGSNPDTPTIFSKTLESLEDFGVFLFRKETEREYQILTDFTMERIVFLLERSDFC